MTTAEPRSWARLGFLLRRALVMTALAAVLLPAGKGVATASTSGVSPPRALVLDPFASDLGHTPGSEPDVAGVLQKAGYSVTVLRDRDVTLPSMLHLSKYSFIYMSTHAGPLPNSDAAISTGDTTHRKYGKYFANFSVAQMHIARAGVMRWFNAITGRFVHLYVGTFPAHTVIFINSCNVLDMPLFWKYLHQAGVATLISWHHHVNSSDADRAAVSVMTDLAGGSDVYDAVASTVASGAGTSITDKKKAGELAYLGDSTTTLQLQPTRARSSR